MFNGCLRYKRQFKCI